MSEKTREALLIYADAIDAATTQLRQNLEAETKQQGSPALKFDTSKIQWKKPRVLDVGCGAQAQGDVNVDLYPEDRQQCRKVWNPKNVKNFVLADAAYLPFQNDAFDLLTARHVLEHLHEPLQALNEWKRVSPTVHVTTPSEYSLDRTATHLYTWNISSLKNLLNQVFIEVQVSYTTQKNVLFGWLLKRLPLVGLLLNRFPSEIKATCYG